MLGLDKSLLELLGVATDCGELFGTAGMYFGGIRSLLALFGVGRNRWELLGIARSCLGVA